jgi:hypothetical protein
MRRHLVMASQHNASATMNHPSLTRRQWLAFARSVDTSAGLHNTAHADTWPTKAIRFNVPFALEAAAKSWHAPRR